MTDAPSESAPAGGSAPADAADPTAPRKKRGWLSWFRRGEADTPEPETPPAEPPGLPEPEPPGLPEPESPGLPEPLGEPSVPGPDIPPPDREPVHPDGEPPQVPPPPGRERPPVEEPPQPLTPPIEVPPPGPGPEGPTAAVAGAMPAPASFDDDEEIYWYGEMPPDLIDVVPAPPAAAPPLPPPPPEAPLVEPVLEPVVAVPAEAAPPPAPVPAPSAPAVESRVESGAETVAEVVAEVTGLPVPVLPAPEPGPAPEPAAKKSWFQRLKEGLSRSSSRLTQGITDLFTKRKLDGAALEELEELLITADLGVTTAGSLTAALAKSRFNQEVSAEEVRGALADEITRLLEPVAQPLVIDRTARPHVVLVVGVNGSGKTTTIGKMARQFRDDGLTVSIAAGDTFRAAAVEQLRVWGERSDCPVIARQTGADAAGLAFDALTEARSRGDDVLLIDTAGRLQNKAHLMAELQKIVRVLGKLEPSAPHTCLLVLDATVGQNAHSQVEVFRQMTAVGGLVLTKLDGTAKGGVMVALAEKFKLPVHYIGIGEKVEDLRPFSARDFARGLMGLDA